MENDSPEKDTKVNPTDQPPGTGLTLNLSDIEALRDRIEQQKANKLKAEQLVSTLSRIKTREKTTKRNSRSGDNKSEDGISSQHVKRSGNSTSILKEKSNLLKKKLEEDRAKLESKRGQEDLERVSEIVEHIRVQLEDQDKSIQQLHSNFASTTKPTVPVEEVSPPEPEVAPEVKQRISELEMKVLDLQENLREKDSVISARTQAITLLSEDMARKGKNTLDTLEETRSQMKIMQANFVALEDRMNEEKVRLKEELENKKTRLIQIEKNYRAAESARFDLSTRVAELQEKVVTLQSKNLALEEEKVQADNKTKELTESLENSNKHAIKMKAQFKAKLKAIEEERDTLKKGDKTSEELNRLRERIADLEDEKEAGNLLKERIAEMEEKLMRQECDLDSHFKAMKILETEKLDLLEVVNKKSDLISEKEDMIHSLQRQIHDIEERKVGTELKCLELEEKLDAFIKTDTDHEKLKLELNNANERLLQYQDTIKELTSKLDDRKPFVSYNTIPNLESAADEDKHIQNLTSSLEEWKDRVSLLEEKLNTTLAHCEELENKNMTLQRENELLCNDCDQLKETVNNLNILINSKPGLPDDDSNSIRQSSLEKELDYVTNKNKSLELEVENLRHSLQLTTAQVHDLYQQIEEYSNASKRLEELSEKLGSTEKELESTISTLDERSRKLSEYKKFHKLKSEDVLRVSQELKELSVASQQRISELENALTNSQKIEEDLKNELKGLKETNEAGTIDKKIQEQSLKMKKIAASLKLKTKLLKDYEAKVEELENVVRQNQVLISSLQSEKTALEKELVENIQPIKEFSNTTCESDGKNLTMEVALLKEKLENKIQELESLRSSSCESYDYILQIKELENQNKKLHDISDTKSDQLKKLEKEIADLNGINKSLLTDLEQMQESYRQDALKNESVLDGFEHEMLGNKNDIVELSNQLMDVTSKYEQAWAKLQEKEVYIEDLEQQLEKVKFRLQQIETTVEERRRSLEDKAEMLGSRLWQAEKNNEQLEKHEGELEQKIANLLNTEELLSNVLQKLQQENCEMSKSFNEYSEKNAKLSDELDRERVKVSRLTQELNTFQDSLINQEKVKDDYENIKAQLKEAQELHQQKVSYLENCLTESEQCMDSEIKRLADKVTTIENERQEIIDKCNSLELEKKVLEEEYSNLQETVLDITKTEIEQLKSNQENLSEQLNRELDKRETYIERIKELESLLEHQNKNNEDSLISNPEEIVSLKDQIDKARKENEVLRLELVKEKAVKQVDDVVLKAEETYFTMISPSASTSNTLLTVKSNDAVGNPEDCSELDNLRCDKPCHIDEINKLKDKLSNLQMENASLKDCLNAFESGGKMMAETDWTTASKDEDDGWGWGSNDAMLDQEYNQKQKAKSKLEEKVVDLESKLDDCEKENKILADELKASQLKSAKLLKKVKEFKIKSDSLERNSREKSVGFDDLDFALQEELRAQVDKLEKSLKECNSNLSSFQTERENLMKRIEMLTAGNERLVELKERQDIEVEMWQRRSNELQNKVQSLEWSLAEYQTDHIEGKDIASVNELSLHGKQLENTLEMEEKINMLAAENEYLQSLVIDLKDKNIIQSNITSNQSKMDVNKLEENKVNSENYLLLQQENHRLNELTKILGEKLNVECDNITAENISKYLHKIEELLSENEQLAYTLEKITNESELKQNLVQSLNETCDHLKSENSKLSSLLDDVNEQLNELKMQSELTFTEKTNTNLNQLHEINMQSVTDMSTSSQNIDDSKSNYNLGSSPILFQGFTANKDLAELPSKSTLSVFDTTSKNVRACTDFFDTINLEPETREEKQISNMSELNLEMINDSPENSILRDYIVKIDDLNKSLSAKDIEIINLQERITKHQQETKALLMQLENLKKAQSLEWNPFSDINSDSSAAWDSELLKKLEEKDSIIKILKQQLLDHGNQLVSCDSQFTKLAACDISTSSLEGDVSYQQRQIQSFVDEISQLNNALKEKEREISLLCEENKNHKDIGSAKEKSDNVLQHKSEEEQLTTQNIYLNQLLEDKETELEIMSQQMEQSKVAKDNLQDELSLTLSEIEAVSSPFAIPEISKEVLLPPAQPENIEEVKTLCAEVEELTKLLQEKESEVEILKQQIDELNLEKESLIDEWKKEIKEYKDNSIKYVAKTNELEFELENLKTVTISEIEKQFKDELSLKEQQLMNIMNDLHNTNSYCEDLQSKIKLVEENHATCDLQKEQLITELNAIKTIHNKLEEYTKDVDCVREMSLSDKVQVIKDNLIEIDHKFNEAMYEIKTKDDTISELKSKIQYLESTTNINESSALEKPVFSKQVKPFTSEPFRISTEMSSSDDDSSSRHMDSDHVPVLLMKEIQSLKQVLAMKDAEITRMSIALNEAQENLIKGELRFINSEEESLRHRLDEALYTLHLRDVRCDELALELMQLLEERDSLQLRLSTAIRFNEELRRKSQLLDEAAIQMESETNDLSSKKENERSDEQLKEKLDQLHNVGYRRDPGLQQEQQKRHQEHMQLYTQPAQDEPQQSSGFFNWIFGGSSPGSQDG